MIFPPCCEETEKTREGNHKPKSPPTLVTSMPDGTIVKKNKSRSEGFRPTKEIKDRVVYYPDLHRGGCFVKERCGLSLEGQRGVSLPVGGLCKNPKKAWLLPLTQRIQPMGCAKETRQSPCKNPTAIILQFSANKRRKDLQGGG